MESNKELNLVFMDQEKAFDIVNRNKLWKTLEEHNVKWQLSGQYQSHLLQQHECNAHPRWTHGMVWG